MMKAHVAREKFKNVNHTSRLVRLRGLRLEYRLVPSPKGCTVTVTMEKEGRRTQGAVLFPRRSLAEEFLLLASRHLVTPGSLFAVYDDFLAVALSLLP